MDNKQADDITSLQRQVKELGGRIEKLENAEIQNENRGMNDKLSNYAYKTVQGSRGPLKPDEFLKHFTDDVFGKKEAMAVIRKFPNNMDEVKNQLSHIHENIEHQMMFRKKEQESDVKLIKRIRKFNETVEETSSCIKPKKQCTMDQFLDKKSQNVSAGNKKTLSKAKVVGKSKAVKSKMRVKEGNKENRKIKNRNEEEDEESCSSPEIEVDQITAKLTKRLKLNLSQEIIQSNAVEDSGVFSERREPRPMINSPSSLEGSSQSDVISEDDTPEIFTEAKTVITSGGKRSKHLTLRSNKMAPECNGDEETVHEKHLPSRGKQIR